MNKNDVIALTPALFPDFQPIWMMLESASRFGIPLRPYGMNQPYKGWVDVKIHKLVEETQKIIDQGKSHVIYTDGRDVFYLAPIDEILDKYQKIYGAPKLLQSSEAGIFESYASYYNLNLYPTRAETGHPFTFPGSCAFMGEVQFIHDQLFWMQQNYPFGGENSMPDDDPAWWRRWDNEHQELLRDGTVKFDYDCHIFQNCGNTIDGGGQFDVALTIKADAKKLTRIYNYATNAWPCMLHFNGGYSHALHGKWHIMEYYWKQLGYTSRPPWEEQ